MCVEDSSFRRIGRIFGKQFSMNGKSLLLVHITSGVYLRLGVDRKLLLRPRVQGVIYDPHSAEGSAVPEDLDNRH